ncbi:hypothetical protein J2S43_005892 [Catenuloplanes nepalensis]|uniref:Uncharacterized protein n=1 Tax=Catenuloplanes nepalensis TaxID=587533 RepID=A0ABT9N110_9ACTN|nr:hypothetical protein [Catenuloplanes nepalensis]MDP9797380.1 hypothetical protein [Catenuloplanes nepalensis]
MSAEEYRRQLAALAEATARRDAELLATERAYHDGAATATAELVRAEAMAAAAARRSAALTASVADVDREASRIWAALRALHRRRPGWAARVGDPPEPVLPQSANLGYPDQAAPETRAVALLDRATRRIDSAKRGTARPSPPRRVLPLLPVVGAAAAAFTALFAAGLVTLGGGHTTTQLVLRTAGWSVFFVAPFTGLPLAAALLHRLFGSRLDIGAVGLLVLGGMAAATGISIALAD